MDKKTLWESTLAELELNLSAANFQTWFKGKTSIVGQSDSLLEIGCNSSYIKNWLESRYQGQIKSILERVSGKKINIVFTVDPTIKELAPKKLHQKKFAASQTPTLFPESGKSLIDEAISKAELNPTFNFNEFVVGTSNQLAHAAAKAICQDGAGSFNLLFIYGDVGVGKTHLIQAIGQEALYKNIDNKIAYCTCEEFTNQLVAAIQTRTTLGFRNKYRRLDLLLLDDIQFLSGRDSTQEELFNTLNALSVAGKKVVVTSDRPPSAVKNLEERLRSRFEGGMVADIAQPDIDLREAVLRQKCASSGTNLSSQIIHLLAESFPRSMRDLEGGLVRLTTYSRVTNRPVSRELLEEVVKVTNRDKAKNTAPAAVLEQVAKYFSVSQKDIKSRSRESTIVLPRQIIMYILREDLGIGFSKIARFLGRDDHTGIIYSVKKIKTEVRQGSKTRELVGEIRKRIFG